jgi:hypothetical protein
MLVTRRAEDAYFASYSRIKLLVDEICLLTDALDVLIQLKIKKMSGPCRPL